MQQLLRDDIEYVVHCEPDGTVIGPISKKHAHLDGVRENSTHYSTWSMIYNPVSKQYGIQLKNPQKHDKYSGGKWDMGAAGHNCYVEDRDNWRYLDFEENLVKETQEEIGLEIKMFTNLNEFIEQAKSLKRGGIGYIIDRFHYKSDHNSEFVGLGLILTTETNLDFTDNEVIDFKWLSSDDLKKFMQENDNWVDPLRISFKKAEKFISKNL